MIATRRLKIRRVSLVLPTLLTLATGSYAALPVRAAAVTAVTPLPQDEIDRQSWTDRLATLTDGDWRAAYGAGNALAEFAPDTGYGILADNWKALPPKARQQMLKAWYFAMPYPLHPRMHPRLLDVLDLGVTDTVPDVQSWAFNFLRGVACQDFAEDFGAYRKWYDENRTRPVADVMSDACRRFTREMAAADPAERDRLAVVLAELDLVFRDVAPVRATARDAGMLDVVATWIEHPNTPRAANRAAMDALAQLEPDEAYVRRVVLPAATQTKDLDLATSALRVLGDPRHAWAVDDLLGVVTRYLDHGKRGSHWFAAGALAEIGDPRVIPTLIAVIDADNGYETVYGVGYFGLGKLTGVKYDESHDGAWWRAWWEKNRERYPEDVRTLEIPTLKIAKATDARRAAGASGDPADIPSQDIFAEGDVRKRYFLIGPADFSSAPPHGFKLLLVLPGGDGGPDFHPFVKSIQAEALPGDYLVAQLVAPQWSADQKEKIVWPTTGLPWEGMQFPTESFVDTVITDIGKRYPLDATSIFTLSWSSGGPAAYATSVAEGTRVTGSFVAMSVFKPDQLPTIANAKGKAYYILHSPDDFIAMRFPERARDDLASHGATTKLATYAGGHGWHGDVYGMIREGVAWLEAQTGAK